MGDTGEGNQADRIEHGTDMRGEKHPLAKLTDEDVHAIRSRYAAGGITYKILGAQYGVTATMACAIVRRKSWKHI